MIIEKMEHFPWIATFVGAIASYLFAWAWYSPWACGTCWKESHHMECKECCSKTKKMVLGFLVTLLSAFVLVGLLHHFHVTELKDALCFAFWVWLGFSAANQLSGVIWSKYPLKAFFVESTQNLISLLIIAAVATFLKA
jgi:hypothetical protein